MSKIIRNLIFLLAITINLSCGQKSLSQKIYVSAISDKNQIKLNQNLQNKIIPSPEEFISNRLALVSDNCDNFRNQTIPKDWIQDKIEVPEDPAYPNGKKINVFYYGQIKPGSIPTVYFNGGPSSDSHNSYSTVTNAQKFFDPNKNISYIFIDQRGTGCSDFYPQGNSEDTLARLRNYGTAGIVSDAELIRKKLIGNKKWNVFGQSYGAFIVHRYTILNPGSIHAAFAHANVINSNGYERIKNRIISQVRIMNDYLKEFPDDEVKLQILKSSLGIDKCFISENNITQKACGNRPLELIAAKLLGFSNQWLKIHQWLGIMVDGNQINEAGIGQFLNAFYFGNSNPLNSTAIAGKVIDWVDRGLPEMDSYTCSKIQSDLFTVGIDLQSAYSHECMKTLQLRPNTKLEDTSLPYQKLKQDLMNINTLYSVLSQHNELPFYIYSASKDAYVPYENFEEEMNLIKELKNVFYTHFKDTGHDEYLVEPLTWKDLLNQSKSITNFRKF